MLSVPRGIQPYLVYVRSRLHVPWTGPTVTLLAVLLGTFTLEVTLINHWLFIFLSSVITNTQYIGAARGGWARIGHLPRV